MTDIEEIDEDELLYCRVGVLRRDAVGVAGVAEMIEGLKLERSTLNTLPLSKSLVFVAPKFRGTASRYDRPMTSAEVNAIFEVPLVLVVNLQVPTCYEVHNICIYVRT